MTVKGDRLNSLITEKGYNKTSFSQLTGISRSIISQLCNNTYKSTLSDYTFTVICKALAVNPEYLTGASDYRSSEHYLECLTDSFNTIGRTSDLLADLLENENILQPGSGPDTFRIYEKTGYDYIEMSEIEKERFLQLIRKGIIDLCTGYVSACKIHDESNL